MTPYRSTTFREQSTFPPCIEIFLSIQGGNKNQAKNTMNFGNYQTNLVDHHYFFRLKSLLTNHQKS